MTPHQFQSWRQHMRLSKTRAAKALGISPSSVDLYERGERRGGDRRPVIIPLAIELACAALALGVTRYSGPSQL